MDNLEERGLGALPPKIDVRDYKVAGAAVDTTALPKSFSLNPIMSIKSQGSVSSCVAHAVSSILEYHARAEHKLSTNFIYGAQFPLFNRDGKGMFLRDACKIVKDYGDPLEADCPGNFEVRACYDDAEAALNNEEIMKVALRFRIKSYVNLDSDKEIKYAIMNYGPVLASVKWYRDTVVRSGVMESKLDGDYGYHAIVLYGWNEKGFLMQNSWGRFWGDNGRAILPYNYGICEAKALVDDERDDIVVPKRNKFIDILYRILNYVLNLFYKR
jgi:C1A family cysteine protease